MGRDKVYLHGEGGAAPRMSDSTGYDVHGGMGDDVIDARDGGPSRVDCGRGSDRLLADPDDRAVRRERRTERPR